MQELQMNPKKTKKKRSGYAIQTMYIINIIIIKPPSSAAMKSA
jgi:hypothetical protein